MPFPSFAGVRLRVSNYKSFGEVPQGFDELRPINVLIGRNNSGKSALLDVIEALSEPPELLGQGHRGQTPVLHFEMPASESALRKAFPEGRRGGQIPGRHHWQYGSAWLDKPFRWSQPTLGGEPEIEGIPGLDVPGAEEHHRVIHRHLRFPLLDRWIQRLAAERDIRPEPASNSLELRSNGGGATNCIQGLINLRDRPSEVVEQTMLRDLNRIFKSDARFNRITAQMDPGSNLWEVYLHDEGRGRVALSHTGSGLKTVLLVLCIVHILPVVRGVDIGNSILLLEELENNLHPALERRLLEYLRDVVEDTGAVVFITTHSPIAIDFFSTDEAAQLLHVVHDGTVAAVRPAKTYVDNCGVLDDLDVRASDLLQANGIIWVEGPSDRLYVSRWIELASKGTLQEGIHYQCLFYGGRLLAHLSAAAPDVAVTDVVRMLSVNRNAVLMMDSDRSGEDEQLNTTKRRVLQELKEIGMIGWVTDGREVENYLSASVVSSVLGRPVEKAPPRNRHFMRYLEAQETGRGERFSKNKVLFAERACAAMTEEDLDRLDLRDRVAELCRAIRRWNQLGDKAAT